MGGTPSTCVVRRRKALRYGSNDLAVEKCVKSVDGGIGAVLEQPPYLVSVNATLLCPAHSETSRTLQPAATMIATKLCRRPWKVMSSNPARSRAGRKTARPHERKSGPPAGAVNTRASAVWSTNSERCCSSRRMTERATGTERFERVVLGSLSKVTRPRNWTAVDVTRMRE